MKLRRGGGEQEALPKEFIQKKKKLNFYPIKFFLWSLNEIKSWIRHCYYFSFLI